MTLLLAMKQDIRNLLLLLIFLTLSIAFGCRNETPRVNIVPTQTKIIPSQYRKFLKQWTRSYKVIKKFDTTLDVYAVLLSWEFRWAYTTKFAHDYSLTEVQKQQFWTQQQELLGKYIEFMVSASCAEYEWNDLDKGNPKIENSGPTNNQKTSIWRVILIVDNEQPIEPIEIKLIDPITDLHRTFFPFIGHFHRLYKIRFPAKYPDGRMILSENTQKIILKFSGPLGKANLVWLTTKAPVEE